MDILFGQVCGDLDFQYFSYFLNYSGVFCFFFVQEGATRIIAKGLRLG